MRVARWTVFDLALLSSSHSHHTSRFRFNFKNLSRSQCSHTPQSPSWPGLFPWRPLSRLQTVRFLTVSLSRASPLRRPTLLRSSSLKASKCERGYILEGWHGSDLGLTARFGEGTMYYKDGRAGSCGEEHSDGDMIAALVHSWINRQYRAAGGGRRRRAARGGARGGGAGGGGAGGGAGGGGGGGRRL